MQVTREKQLSPKETANPLLAALQPSAGGTAGGEPLLFGLTLHAPTCKVSSHTDLAFKAMKHLKSHCCMRKNKEQLANIKAQS